MKSWLFWAGISFIIGGAISLALNLGVQERLSTLEDLTGYSIGWMVVGLGLLTYSLLKSKMEQNHENK